MKAIAIHSQWRCFVQIQLSTVCSLKPVTLGPAHLHWTVIFWQLCRWWVLLRSRNNLQRKWNWKWCLFCRHVQGTPTSAWTQYGNINLAQFLYHSRKQNFWILLRCQTRCSSKLSHYFQAATSSEQFCKMEMTNSWIQSYLLLLSQTLHPTSSSQVQLL